MKHPIPPDTKVISIHGEVDEADPSDVPEGADTERHTGPNAVGVIIRRDYYADYRWTYQVEFPNGTSVFITQDEIEDPTSYRVI